MAQFNEIFGFPNQGISCYDPIFEPHQAWEQLTGQPARSYNLSRSKASALSNHALRYIHRVMAHSIFGRGFGTGMVNRIELLFLWAMVNNVQVNTGAWLLKHLLHVSRMSSGSICVGGILSIIAQAFGFEPIPNIHHRAEGSHLMDLATLVNVNVCRHLGNGEYRLLDDDGQIIEQEWMSDDEEPEPEPIKPEIALPEEHMPGANMQEPERKDREDQTPPPSQNDFMKQMMERIERLETRMSRSEERSAIFEAQIRAWMKREEEATSRMEDRIARWK